MSKYAIKTIDQAADEIQKLEAIKEKIHSRNHDAIGAQIKVLSQRLSHDAIYNRWGDEGLESYDEAL